MPDPTPVWKKAEVSRSSTETLLKKLPEFHSVLALCKHETGFRIGLFRGERSGPKTDGMWVLLYPEESPLLTDPLWRIPARAKATAQPPTTWANKRLLEYSRKQRKNRIRLRTSNATGKFLWQVILGAGVEEVRTAFWPTPEKALIDLAHRTDRSYSWDPQAALVELKEA